MENNIIVGMSGGVDSSVTAWLLLEQGYTVTGLFMKNWEEDDGTDQCTAIQDLADAQQVCDTLKIPLKTVNFSAEYWDEVFEDFLKEYREGRTPNPDILCNKHIKFKAFLDYALELGATKIATGHYARIGCENNHFQLLKGLDQNKEQSYFLYTLGQKELAKTLFPIGQLTKIEIREIAKKLGLDNHNKKDSTGICFIGERKFTAFLKQYIPSQPGDIQTPEGKQLGRHEGLMFYTLGQRQGLGLGGIKGYPEAPWYVLEKDTKRNILIVGQGHDHPLLFHDSLIASDVTWTSKDKPDQFLACTAKIRYRQADQLCSVMPLGEESKKYQVTFNNPQRAITPGQSVVFYKGDHCLGGGIINAN